MYGPTKTESGVREVPYFGYFKQFPKTRVAIAKTLAEHGVTIHSLRKTYEYFLKTNDVHVTIAAKFLGHSDPMVSLQIYTLVRDTEINQAGFRLRQALCDNNLVDSHRTMPIEGIFSSGIWIMCINSG